MVSAETSAWTDKERARVLLADLIDWHRREDKPACGGTSICAG
jgi:hypothetical protein